MLLTSGLSAGRIFENPDMEYKSYTKMGNPFEFKLSGHLIRHIYSAFFVGVVIHGIMLCQRPAEL